MDEALAFWPWGRNALPDPPHVTRYAPFFARKYKQEPPPYSLSTTSRSDLVTKTNSSQTSPNIREILMQF